MCRLYSSPKSSVCFTCSAARVHAHRIAVRPNALPIRHRRFRQRRVQQRRVPQPPACIAGDQSFTLPKQAQLCCVILQAQYQAFVRFAVMSSTASAIALERPLRSGTVDRRGSCAPGFLPLCLRGQPATLDRCCGRKLVVPGGNSKRFFCVPIGLYRGNLRAPTALGMPARSALGGRWGVSPAAVIKASIWAAWPWPASTTSGAFGPRMRAA